MPTRVVDLESGRAWELWADERNRWPTQSGSVSYRYRVNRKQSADVPLTKPWISKHHGQIHYDEGAWWLVDGGSVNTVTVNGVPVVLRRAIADGDVLGFGNTSLRFESDGGPPAPRPG